MRTLVCAIAKKENHYLREWVEWYKNIGFTNICIYDNNDIDGECFDEVIGDYIESKYVIVKDKRGKTGHINWNDKNQTASAGPYHSLQAECYNECYHTIAYNYDWVMYVDIDEFLFFQPGWDLQKLLTDEDFKYYQFIGVSRIDMGDSGLVCVKNNNYNCVERFTEPDLGRYWIMFKPIIRTCIPQCVINSAHGFEWGHIFQENNDQFITGVLTDGSEISPKGIIKLYKAHTDKCYIRHYITKTLEEFIESKIQRGWPDDYSKLYNLDLQYFFDKNKVTPEKLEYLKTKGIEFTPKE